MNERIKQLIKQCYETGPIGKDGWPEYSNLNEEKFAKLIVRECVDIVSDTAVNTPPNDLFYGYNLGVNKAAENIKERFGIEE